MKKITILFWLCAFVSMACMGVGSAAGLSAVDVPGTASTLTNTSAPGATDRATTAPTLLPIERCAVVIADQSLHLRELPSETARVLTWLKRGDVVHVVSIANMQWTHVRFEGFEGFARSIYLEESECVK
jgi:uncharacterized protein YgiM (DUF1202 family)